MSEADTSSILRHQGSESNLYRPNKNFFLRTLAEHTANSLPAEDDEILARRHRSLRFSLGEYIESRICQIILLILVFIDVLAVTCELILAAVCSSTETEHATHILHIISLSILYVFLIQQIGLLIAFDVHFFTHPLYILDLVVVVVAICLEHAVHSDAAGLIIVVAIWRIIRVFHGLAISVELEAKAGHQARARLSELVGMVRILSSYEATALRMLHMRVCARIIQHAVRVHYFKPGGAEARAQWRSTRQLATPADSVQAGEVHVGMRGVRSPRARDSLQRLLKHENSVLLAAATQDAAEHLRPGQLKPRRRMLTE